MSTVYFSQLKLRDAFTEAENVYRACLRAFEAGRGPVTASEQLGVDLARTEMQRAYAAMRAAQPPVAI